MAWADIQTQKAKDWLSGQELDVTFSRDQSGCRGRNGGVRRCWWGIGSIAHATILFPKKCVGRLLGHNKGVHRLRLFPHIGHLFLSAGLEGKYKIWIVLQSLEKKCWSLCSARLDLTIGSSNPFGLWSLQYSPGQVHDLIVIHLQDCRQKFWARP